MTYNDPEEEEAENAHTLKHKRFSNPPAQSSVCVRCSVYMRDVDANIWTHVCVFNARIVTRR